MTAGGRLLSRCLFVLLILGPVSPAQDQQNPTQPPPAQTPPAEELLRQANTALQSEDYAAAAAVLETYLAQAPDDYRAKFNLALAFSMTGRQGDAIRLYRDVLAQQPELVPARVNLGILLLQQGNSAEALEAFQLVLTQQPDHWAAQVNRAGALVALNRNPEAAQAYARALELNPDHAPTQLAYGKVLSELDPAAAESPLRRALELDASLEEARLVLAGVLVDRSAQGADTASEAISIYQELIRAHPDDTDLRLRLANTFLSQQRLPEAIQELELARAAAPAVAELNRALLEVYLQAKEHAKAQALLPDVLAQNPGDADLHMLQGSLLMEQREYPNAAEAFRRAIDLAPRDEKGYTNLASSLYLMKDYEGTARALQDVAALGKDTAGSYFLRAITLDRLGLKDAAYDNYQNFLATDEQRNPDQEFQARQRLIVLERELKRSPRR